jgi:hypothetical protein
LVGTFGDVNRRTQAMDCASMASKQDQQKRRKLPRKPRPLGKSASTPGRGMEMPTRPAGLDPIVVEIIEALARTIIRDEDRRATSSFRNKKD